MEQKEGGEDIDTPSTVADTEEDVEVNGVNVWDGEGVLDNESPPWDADTREEGEGVP